MSKSHAIERTSPKGQPFIGVCIKCGTTGLSIFDAIKPCQNPANLSPSEVMNVVLRDKGSFQ